MVLTDCCESFLNDALGCDVTRHISPTCLYLLIHPPPDEAAEPELSRPIEPDHRTCFTLHHQSIYGHNGTGVGSKRPVSGCLCGSPPVLCVSLFQFLLPVVRHETALHQGVQRHRQRPGLLHPVSVHRAQRGQRRRRQCPRWSVPVIKSFYCKCI